MIKYIKRMANHPGLLAISVLGTLLLAAAAFSVFESASFLDGLYWASTTLTSVGYGDLSPATAVGKVFTIVFQLWSLFVLLPCAVANVIDSLRVDEHKMTNDEQEWLFDAVTSIAQANDVTLPAQPDNF